MTFDSDVYKAHPRSGDTKCDSVYVLEPMAYGRITDGQPVGPQ